MKRIDLIIHNGVVMRMVPGPAIATAIAISGNIITAIGSDTEILALGAARIIDARGGTIMPGFIEAHMHLFAGAAELDNLDLSGVSGFSALQAAVDDYVASHHGVDLIIANQANYTILSATQTLTRHHLDQILPDRPILVFSPDHHTAWANTIALKRAGILHGKVCGAGNEVVMEAGGMASGELREGQAIDPVMALSPSGNRDRLGLTTGGEPEGYPTPEQFDYDLSVIKRGLAHCAKYGITSFHNMDGNFYTLELLAALEQAGELTARAYVPFHFKNFMAVAALERASSMAKAYNGPMIKSGFVKLFMDGVLDSWTAVMLDDYADRAGWRGEPLFSQSAFNEIAIEADARGLQIAVHSIGDGAVNMVLNGYEAAALANGKRDSRHRVEHIEVIARTDIARMKRLGAVASMQPPHPPGNHGLPLEPTISRIGQAKWPLAYAWNDIRAAGIPLVFASDWPVSDINPIRSIQSAMTRQKWADDMPDQRQSLEQAVAGYTVDAAYAEFAEGTKGQLAVGMLADVIVLSEDIAAVDPARLHEIVPVVTICDGRVVWQT